MHIFIFINNHNNHIIKTRGEDDGLFELIAPPNWSHGQSGSSPLLVLLLLCIWSHKSNHMVIGIKRTFFWCSGKSNKMCSSVVLEQHRSIHRIIIIPFCNNTHTVTPRE